MSARDGRNGFRPMAWRIANAGLLLAAGAFALVMPRAPVNADPVTAEALARQAAEYKADVPKTVLELQQFRESASAPAEDGRGRGGSATLVNLNPRINAGFC